jgi:hypothetical protein
MSMDLHVGFRFQRRIKILPGLAINISKSGVGFSAGRRGFHAGIDAKGRRYTASRRIEEFRSKRRPRRSRPGRSSTALSCLKSSSMAGSPPRA